MFLNIITPCSRPENLHKISSSINIPKKNYRWIVVCDMNELPNKELIPDNCEIYTFTSSKSISGNAQRNFALDMIKEGHIYINDDDTTIHPDLWENIKNLNNDFISFSQNNINGNLRLDGKYIKVGHIDSHNFIICSSIMGKDRWDLEKYAADGHFAEKIFKKSINPINITKVLSIYNSLR